MKQCKTTVSQLQPRFQALSAYFFGADIDLDYTTSPCERIGGLQVRYNPDLDRPLEIQAVSPFKLAQGSVIPFFREPDG